MGKKRTEQFVMRLLIWNALLRTIEMSFFAMMGVLRATHVAGMFVVIGRRRYTRASAFKLRSTQRHSMSFFHVRL